MSTEPPPTSLTQSFPTLAALSRQDIEDLLAPASAPYFDALFHALPQVQALYAHHSRLLAANEAKARENTALQQPLEALRAETQQLFDRATRLEAQWPALEAEMTELYKRFSQSALLFQLNQSANTLHQRSEHMANAYVEGLPYPISDDAPPGPGPGSEQPLDDVSFVRRYKAQRMLYHRRKLIAERWSRGQVHWSEQ